MLRTFPGPSHSEFRCLSGILTHADEELVQQSQRIPKKVDNRLQLDAAVAFYLIQTHSSFRVFAITFTHLEWNKLIMGEHLSPSPCVLSKSEVESCWYKGYSEMTCAHKETQRISNVHNVNIMIYIINIYTHIISFCKVFTSGLQLHACAAASTTSWPPPGCNARNDVTS